MKIIITILITTMGFFANAQSSDLPDWEETVAYIDNIVRKTYNLSYHYEGDPTTFIITPGIMQMLHSKA